MDKTENAKPAPTNVRRREASERSERSESSVSRSLRQLAYFTPDHGWCWLCMLAGCFVHVFVGGLDRSFGIFYMELRDYFNVGAAITAGISGTMTSLRLLLGPLASALSNRYGTRKVAVAGGVIYATGLTLSAFRPSIAFNYLTLGVMTGVGGALLFTPTYVCLNHHFERWRAIAIGISTAGAGIGTFMWPQVTYLLLNSGTYAEMMLILGGISCNLILCGAVFRPVNLLLNRVRSRATTLAADDTDDANLDAELEAETELNERDVPTLTGSFTAVKERSRKQVDETYKACLSTPVLSSKTREDAKMTLSTPSLGKRKQKISDTAVAQFYANMRQAAPKNTNLYNSADVVLWPDDEASESIESEESTEGQYCGKLAMLFKRFARMFDLHLLTNYKFMFLAIACCCTNFAYQGIPTLLVHHITIQLNLDRNSVRHIISTIGIADTASRVLIGLLFDIPFLRRFRRFVWTLTIILIGIVIFLFAFADSLTAFYVLTVFYGITVGIYTSQLTVIVVDTVPSKRLMPNAIGLTIFFRGIGVLLGIVLAGLMKDITTTYAASFCLCGAVAVFGGVLFMITTIVCCGGAAPATKTTDPESRKQRPAANSKKQSTR